jgi:hypothetical protein
MFGKFVECVREAPLPLLVSRPLVHSSCFPPVQLSLGRRPVQLSLGRRPGRRGTTFVCTRGPASADTRPRPPGLTCVCILEVYTTPVSRPLAGLCFPFLPFRRMHAFRLPSARITCVSRPLVWPVFVSLLASRLDPVWLLWTMLVPRPLVLRVLFSSFFLSPFSLGPGPRGTSLSVPGLWRSVD